MTAAYYKPSGKVSFLGLAVAIFVGGFLVALLAIVYAALLVYNPSAYLGIALPLLYGAGAGAIVSMLGRRFKVRNAWLLGGVGTAIAMGGYALSWIPWEWLTLSHLGSEVDLIAVLYPPSFLDILGLIYENGAWTIGSSGSSGGAVSGAMLGLVWLLEAAMVLGASALAAFSLGSAGVFCETCETWCTRTKELFRHGAHARAQLAQQLEQRDLSVLASVPRASPTDQVWVETALDACPCGATNTLLVEQCTRSVDRRGNASTQRLPLVRHLLITKQEADWARSAAGR